MIRYSIFPLLVLISCSLLTACESDEQKAANKATIEMNEARKLKESQDQEKLERLRSRANR